MKHEDVVVRIHAHTRDLPEHEAGRELRPAVHNLIGVVRHRLRSETEQGCDNEGEKGSMPDEECHGVTLDESESISHWTRVGQSPHKLIPTAPVAKPPGVTPRWAMNDQSLAPVTSNGGLRYPLKVRPEPGQAIEVAPGVQWLRMSLPMALNHINLWALEDGDGWTLVDTGMQTSQIAAAWEDVISGPMAGRP